MATKLNDIDLLSKLKNLCHTSDDCRACWIADYELDTDMSEYKNYAIWSKQHFTMYKGFFNEMNDTTCISILDVGCGNGFNTKMISTYFKNAQITGVDRNTECIQFAKEHNNAENVQFIADDVLLFNTEKRYDYIFFLEILEHIKADNHFTVIDKLLELLKEGGLLFITTPNELDNPDATHEHIGLLNRTRARQFIETYSKNIVNSQFYDNKQLLMENNIINEPIQTYEYSSWGQGGINSAPNKSHFKLTLQNLVPV
jgi:2-polyprenyl-3-methyl-5-hydroxy-6-metoxy-1,4-benzoquinol methylase